MSEFNREGRCRRCRVHRDWHSPCEGTIASTYGKDNPLVQWLAEYAPDALREKACTEIDPYENSAREE